MATTPKPVREKQKESMKHQRAHKISEDKIMSKEAKKSHMRSVKEKFKNASKHEISMAKKSIPTSHKHKESDLHKAHAHMEKHKG